MQINKDHLSLLKDKVSYDKEAGLFYWKNPSGTKVKPGDVVGSFRNDGYGRAKIGYQTYYLHRLAWLFEYGEIPSNFVIDHIDGSPSNNAISNLRAVTQSQNNENQRKSHKDSASGMLGVSWFAKTAKWRARITVGGKDRTIGYFEDKITAFSAYLDAKKAHHIQGATCG